MSDSLDRLDRTHTAFEDLFFVGERLHELYQDLRNVGNDFLAERVFEQWSVLKAATKMLRDLNVEEVNAQLHQAQESSATILRAALAGAGCPLPEDCE